MHTFYIVTKQEVKSNHTYYNNYYYIIHQYNITIMAVLLSHFHTVTLSMILSHCHTAYTIRHCHSVTVTVLLSHYSIIITIVNNIIVIYNYCYILIHNTIHYTIILL